MALHRTLFALTSAFTMATAVVSAGTILKNCKPGYVALTYDDGPNDYTEALVRKLNEYDVKATFFVNGENFLTLNESDVGQAALKFAYESEHQIASHTYSHKSLNEIDGEEFDEEIVRLEQVVQDLIGVKPAFIRPPYGEANDEAVEKLENKGYTVVNWSTDTKDFESHDTESEMEMVRESFSSANKDQGFIILSHDVFEQTATDLTDALVKYVKDEGFQFATVAECVDKQPYK